jgi:DNA-binding CsgD family transcriptional regulator
MAAFKSHPLFEYIHMKKDYDGSDIVEDCMAMIQQYKQQLSFFHNSAPIFYLYNFVTDRYIIISHSFDVILGYSSVYIMDNGIHEYASYLKKEDLNIYNTRVFPDNLKVLNSIAPEKQKEYVFTTNYRVRNRKGEVLSFIEKYMYIRSTPEGLPIISLGFGFDISDIKSDTKIVHTVKHIHTNGFNSANEYLLKNYYFVKDKDGLLSRRELEVLKWICEGMTSQEIADKLFISINTVHNHKKNMREKTNCKSIAELLSYAIRNKYL